MSFEEWEFASGLTMAPCGTEHFLHRKKSTVINIAWILVLF